MIGWWLVLGLAAASPELTERALDADAYRFCHEGGFDKSEVVRFCALLEDLPPDVCPGMRESCTTDVEERRSGGCNQRDGGGGGERALSAEPEPPSVQSPFELDLPWLTQLFQWIAAILVALVVLVVLRLVVRWFGWGAGEGHAATPVEPLPPSDEDDDDDPLPDVPDLPSADLLGGARRALAEGRLGEAVLLARGAALRALGDRGALRLHRSRTDREYVRTFPREDGARVDLREVVGAAEVHRWGGRELDEPLARGAVEAAARLVGPGLVLLALVLAPATGRAQTPERYGPHGDAALLEVFRLHGYETTWRLTPLVDLGDETDVLVLDAVGVVPEAEQWEALRSWVEAGGVLLVGGDASEGFPELGALESVTDEVVVEGRPVLVDSALPTPRLPASPTWVWRDGLGQPWASVVDDPSAWVVQVLDVGGGVVVSLSEDRLLENASLVHPANEAFLGDVLYAGQGRLGWPLPTPARVQLATREALADGGANNPAGALANARLLPVVLQLLLLWLLAGLWRGWPFRALRDPPDEGRHAFSEHVEAIGQRYARLRASRLVLARAAQLWLARLGPAGLQLAAEREGRSAADAARYVEALEAVAAEPDGPDQDDDLERVEELWRITRGRTA